MADVINFVDRALAPKPDLIVHASDLPATAEALRDLLAASGRLFDRGMPVRIIKPADGGPPLAARLTKHNVVIEAHRLCQPVKFDAEGKRNPMTLYQPSRTLTDRGPASCCDGCDATGLCCEFVPS